MIEIITPVEAAMLDTMSGKKKEKYDTDVEITKTAEYNFARNLINELLNNHTHKGDSLVEIANIIIDKCDDTAVTAYLSKNIDKLRDEIVATMMSKTTLASDIVDKYNDLVFIESYYGLRKICK